MSTKNPKLGELLAAALDRVIAPEPKPHLASAGWRFLNIKKARNEIAQLESTLGLPPSKPLLRIGAANQLIGELQAQLASRGIEPAKRDPGSVVVNTTSGPAPAPPRTTAPAKPRTATATPAAAPTATPLSREKLVKILKVISPLSHSPDDATDQELFECAEKACYQSGCRIPGMRTDNELSEIYWRAEKPEGAGRYLRANARDAIARILKSENKK